MLKRSLVAILSIGTFAMASAVDHVEVADIDSVASITDVEENINDTIVVDSLGYMVRTAESFNALDYALERRHYFKGDMFEKGKFWNNWFVEGGAGVMLFSQPNSTRKLTPVTLGHIHVGKQINWVSSFRVGGELGLGFLKGKPSGYRYAEADIDYMLNLSSYLYGYRPERPFEVSPFIGIGLQYQKLAANNYPKSKKSEWDYNAHAGVQLKFFAGSHSSLAIEPQVMLMSNHSNMDFTQPDFHKYDWAFKTNFKYIYYFDNRLSYKFNAGEFKKRFQDFQRYFREDDADSRRPLFLEYLGGMGYIKNLGNTSPSDTWGQSFSAYAGWWMSNATGFRIGANANFNKWKVNEIQGHGDMPSYERKHLFGTVSGSFDALLNPLGFSRNYNWNAPVGINFLAGLEMGRMVLQHPQLNDWRVQRESRWYYGYRYGAQLWVRLSDNLHFEIEPLFTHYIHKQPRKSQGHFVEQRLRHDHFALRAGLKVFLNNDYAREDAANYSQNPGWFVGLGGGTNFFLQKRYYTGDGKHKLNGLFFVGYQFDNINAIRLNEEILNDAYYDSFTPYTFTRKRDGKTVKYHAHMKRTVTLSMTSLDYQVNVLNLFRSGKPSSRFNVNLMLGPVLGVYCGESDKWDTNLDPAKYDHNMLVDTDAKAYLGLHGGMNLSLQLSKPLSLFYQHNVYTFFGPDDILRSVESSGKYNVFNTLNLGLQYHF